MTIIDELREIGLATRLQRLSDAMRKDVTQIYKEHHLDFESKWFPVLYVMIKKSPISVVELANEIGFAHPSIIALVKEMEKKKLIKSVESKTDGRKRMLSLTPKAIRMTDQLQFLWDDIKKAAKIFSDSPHQLLKAIEETEKILRKESFYTRIKKIQAKRKKLYK